MYWRWQRTVINLLNELLMLNIVVVICLTSLPRCLAKGTKYYDSPPGNIREDNQNTVQWIGGQFEFPCASTRYLFKISGKYIPKNVIATRAQIIKDSIFLTLPRYRNGVPATLVKANIKPCSSSTTFTPYPNWHMQEEGNCKALQSVVDITVDENEVIWVLDTGIVNIIEDPICRCPPKVVAISSTTGKILKTIHLEELAKPNSRLQYLVVDYSPNGDYFVYVSDGENRTIIVFNVRTNRGYRLILPEEVTNGCNLANVLYIALIRKDCGTKELYFTYLWSQNLFFLTTKDIRTGNANGTIVDVGEKPSRIVIIGTDNGSAIFFRYEGEGVVYRWDTTTPFIERYFKPVYRSSFCQLATNAVPDYKRNSMRVLQSNFPDFMNNTMGCGVLQQLTTMESYW